MSNNCLQGCIDQAGGSLTIETALRLPKQLIKERYLTKKEQQPPFVQRATLFQDVVIRCVRYAFSDIPAAVGKVFFSKWVALPFIKFRMLRHGIWKTPIYWREVNEVIHMLYHCKVDIC